MKKVLIIGMGKGMGMALAKKFGKGGFPIIMAARNEKNLKEFQHKLEIDGVKSIVKTVDASDANSVKELIESTQPDIVLYNASSVRKTNLLEHELEDILTDVKVSAGGLYQALKSIYPIFKKKGQGSFLVTGGGFSDNPSADWLGLSMGKAAQRNLVKALHASFKEINVHLGILNILGYIAPQSPKHSPKAIAEQFWKLHKEPKEAFSVEVNY